VNAVLPALPRRTPTTAVAERSLRRFARADINQEDRTQRASLLRPFPPCRTRSWAGWIVLTPDLIPIIGAIGRKQLFVAAGFSGHGFAFGPVIGKLMAELIADGRHSLDLSRFRVNRFAEGDYALPSGAL
jgi:glycine/D-amino acid oxidase-like deaminating enzyme